MRSFPRVGWFGKVVLFAGIGLGFVGAGLGEHPPAPGGAMRAAAQSVDAELRLVPVQQIGGASHAIVSQWDVAFVGLGPRLMSVAVHGDEPNYMGQSEPLPGVVQALAIHGGHVYAAYHAGEPLARIGGVAAILVSDPFSPSIESTVARDVGYADIAVGDGVVVAVGSHESYFADSGVVDVFDSRDPTSLRLASTVTLEGSARAVAMYGDRAYVLEERPDRRTTAVRVFDVSDLDDVTSTSVASVLGEATAIVTDGSYLYVAGGEEAISIVDADPLGLGLVSRLPIEVRDGCASSLTLRDTTLVVGDSCSGAIHWVHVGNPQQPRTYHVLALDVLPGGIANGPYIHPIGDYLYVAAGAAGGMLTVRIEPGRMPRVVGELRAPGAASRLEVVGDQLFTVHRDVGLTATNLEGGRAEGGDAVAATLPLADARDVLASHDRLYVAGGDEGEVYVVSPRPDSETGPERVGSATVEGVPLQMVASGDALFVAAGSKGVRALDLSDPDRPSNVGHFGPHSSRQLARSADILYSVGGLSWMFLLDASDPSQLRELGKVSADASTRIGRAIAADGDMAYVALEGLNVVTSETHTELEVIDASDPAAPSSVARHRRGVPARPRQVTVNGDEMFIAGGEGLSVVRLPATDDAIVVSEWTSPGDASDVRVFDGSPGDAVSRWVYVADGDGGVQVFAVEDSDRPTLTPEPSSTPHEAVPTNEPTPVETIPAPEWSTSLYLPQALKSAKLRPSDFQARFTGSVGGASLGLHVAWPHVYRGDGPHLVTYDVSAPEHIQEVGRSVPLPGFVTDVTVVDGFAFVAASESGLLVLDLSEPEHATLVSQTRTPDAALDVAVVGDHVIVAARDAGLLAFDASNPRSPVLIDRLSLPGLTMLLRPYRGNAIVQSGPPGKTYVVSVDADGGLDVVAELADPDQPDLTGGLALDGDRAFVGLGGVDIAVFDLADAERPVHLGTTRLPRTATSTLAAGGGHVFASGGTNYNELHVIDASEPGSLRKVGSAEGGYPAFDMEVHDGQVIAGSKTTFAHGRDYPAIEVSGPLLIFDVATPDDPMGIGTDWLHSAPILGTARVGDHLYARVAQPPLASDGSFRFRVALVDVTYPGHPTMSKLLEDPGDAYDLAVREDIAFVGTSDGWFEVFDVTSAEMPVRTGRVKLASVPITVAVQDDGPVFAAYAEYDAENQGTITLCVVDVSDRRAPTVVSRVTLAGRLSTMTAADGHAYVSRYSYVSGSQAPDSTLVDVDATSPSAAHVVSSTSFHGNPLIPAVSARGDYVYAALTNLGLATVDMSDREAPQVLQITVARVGTDYDDLAWGDDDLLVAAGDRGLQVFDAEDPTRPRPTEYFHAPPHVTLGQFFAQRPTVASGHVYATYGSSFDVYLGLAAIRLR